MIIKKPYAFLIKNFRIIHALLFVMLIFLAIKSVGIYDFFSDYVSNHYYINQINLASNYVNVTMYIVAIFAIIITSIIYYILSMKDKENKIYLILILYYIVLFAYFIYMHSIFTGLETKTMNAETQRAFRDISFIVMMPQFVFIFIMLLRTLGFNLKQFDFKKDLEDLEIDVTDNEEVEVTIGADTYKVARFFRKLLRLTKYFILENKMFVISVSSVIVFAIAVSLISKVDVFGETYGENQDIISSVLTYNVVESYITSSDYNNTIINADTKYVIVRVGITNKSGTSYGLGRDAFRLQAGNNLLIPVFSLKERFSDLGVTFAPGTINAGEDKEVIIVFEINEKNVAKDFIFKIKTDNVKERYKDIIVKPENIDKSKDMGNYNFPSKIELTDTIFKNSTLYVSSYEIKEKFKEEYNYYVNNELRKGTQFILPDSTNRSESTILKLKANIVVDDNISVSKYLNNAGDLFERYGLLRYRYQGNYKTVKLTKINTNFKNDEYAYLQIPKDIETANKLELILLIRGVKYTFILN